MRKLFYMLSLVGLLGFSGCTDDKDPVINHLAETGELSFILNETPYSTTTYVLLESRGDEVMDFLTCHQPDYGFTAAVNYSVEVSFTPDFTDEYITLPTTVNGEKVNVYVNEVDKAVNQLYGEGNFPEPVVETTIYMRLKAVVSTSTSGPFDPDPIVKPLYSNSIKMNVLPYYMVLKDADPRLYYIIGLADGKWTNDAAAIGSSLIPMSLVEDYAYDPATGDGEFTYTGYFETGKGFKLIRDLGKWDEQWGNNASAGINDPVHNDGGSGNFDVPANGYYTIQLNSIDHTVTFTALEGEKKAYSSIQILGSFTEWEAAEINMTPVAGERPHTWYTTVTFASDAEAKFRAEHDWGTNWGGSSFPYPLKPSGDNIPVKAGTYIITFNDVDGNYYFFAQPEE